MADEPQSGDVLEFPCEFPLKVFGFNNEEFETVVLELVAAHCPPATEFAVARNQSRKLRCRWAMRRDHLQHDSFEFLVVEPEHL